MDGSYEFSLFLYIFLGLKIQGDRSCWPQKWAALFYCLTLRNLVIAMVGLFAATSKVLYPNGWFWTCVQDCVQQPSKNVTSTTLCLLGEIWIKQITTENWGNVMVFWFVCLFWFCFLVFCLFLRGRKFKHLGGEDWMGRLQMPDNRSYLLQSVMAAFSGSFHTLCSKTTSCTV